MGFKFGTEGYDIDRNLSVSFTGHRTDKLPWGEFEDDEECLRFKKRLEAQIIRAYNEGARYFLSGMADGVDIYAAEIVLKLSHKLKEMKLVAVFPYGVGSTKRKRRCARHAYRVVSLYRDYVPSCYMERNRFLVEQSVRIICGFSGEESSGTAATMRMARRGGIDIVTVDI